MAVAILLGGCQTQTPGTSIDVPALLINPDERSRAALYDALSRALNVGVMLAEDALTTSSLLTIERNPPGSLQNPPAQGRVLEKPIQFRLVRNRSKCVLIDLRDGLRYELDDVSCIAE